MVTLGRMLASLLRSWWWLVLLLFAWDLYVRVKGFNVIVPFKSATVFTAFSFFIP